MGVGVHGWVISTWTVHLVRAKVFCSRGKGRERGEKKCLSEESEEVDPVSVSG